MQLGFGVRGDAELGGGGLGDGDEPGGAVAADELAVVVGDMVAVEAVAAAQRGAGDGGEEVLEQEGDAGEGTLGQGLAGLGPGLLVHRGDDRVDARVDGLDALDDRLHELARVKLAGADERGEAEAVEFREGCGGGGGHGVLRACWRRRGSGTC
nr:hypothetical protein [Nannocystis sp.]